MVDTKANTSLDYIEFIHEAKVRIKYRQKSKELVI